MCPFFLRISNDHDPSVDMNGNNNIYGRSRSSGCFQSKMEPIVFPSVFLLDRL